MRSLSYIHSEPTPFDDEYATIINDSFRLTAQSSHVIFAKLGVRKALAELSRFVYPLPLFTDFQWFLQKTKPIGISDGSEVICIAERFWLDSYYKFDWIDVELSSNNSLTDLEKSELLGYVTKLTIYKTLKFQWDRYEV